MSTDDRAAPARVGRFAPSPTGPLHAGSLVAALASWLDVRARGGRWLVRIEDVDTPRCVPGADREILRQLAALGLVPDEPPWWQSRRGEAYAAALASLQARGLAYVCGCSRAQIAAVLATRGQVPARHGEWVYPGTCRPEPPGGAGKASTEGALPDHKPRAHAAGAAPAALTDATGPTDASALPHPPRAHRQAWRLRLPEGGAACVAWIDRRLGAQRQDVAQAVGDFVLKRADGLWAYQLAVVVDDAAQGVSDVVRGEDLADNTPRQILLQRALGLPSPRTLHTPLVRAADGEKLSKQHGAAPLAVDEPLAALQAAAAVLGLRVETAGSTADWLAAAVRAWRSVWIDEQTF